MTEQAQLDQLCIDTLRTLSIDAVQQVQSGHPGTPMGAAPTAYCLWQHFDSVLPPEITARVAVEAASRFGWERYTGFDGTILGLHTFGLSAPMKAIAQHFGFEPAHVVAAAREQMARHAASRESVSTGPIVGDAE